MFRDGESALLVATNMVKFYNLSGSEKSEPIVHFLKKKNKIKKKTIWFQFLIRN